MSKKFCIELDDKIGSDEVENIRSLGLDIRETDDKYQVCGDIDNIKMIDKRLLTTKCSSYEDDLELDFDIGEFCTELVVGGSLDGRKLKSDIVVSDYLEVGGDLDLRGTQIEELPHDLEVSGKIYIGKKKEI